MVSATFVRTLNRSGQGTDLVLQEGFECDDPDGFATRKDFLCVLIALGLPGLRELSCQAVVHSGDQVRALNSTERATNRRKEPGEFRKIRIDPKARGADFPSGWPFLGAIFLIATETALTRQEAGHLVANLQRSVCGELGNQAITHLGLRLFAEPDDDG